MSGAVSAETVFFDNFNDGDAEDAMPVTWVPLPGFPGTFDASSGDYFLAPSERAIVATVPEFNLADVSIRAQVRVLEPSAPGGGVELIARGDRSALDAYLGGLTEDGNLYINPTNTGFCCLAEVVTELRPLDEDIVMQFDVFGTSLSLWAWPADEPRPSAPLLTATDGSYAQGEVGIDYFSQEPSPMLGNAIFRYMQVADTPIMNELPGDYNGDGTVDAADYSVWRDNLGAPAGTLTNDVDGSVIGSAQYATWQANFGRTAGAGSSALDHAAVPEPRSWMLLAAASIVLTLRAKKRVVS